MKLKEIESKAQEIIIIQPNASFTYCNYYFIRNGAKNPITPRQCDNIIDFWEKWKKEIYTAYGQKSYNCIMWIE